MSDNRTDNRRNYGLGTPELLGIEIIGKPRVTQKVADMSCPHCGCDVFEIESEVKAPMLTGGYGIALYIGCPACPFASPMMMMAVPRKQQAKNPCPDNEPKG